MTAPPHPTPEEIANTIRLYTHWNALNTVSDVRTWDDVRKDIAEALRAERRAAFERALEILRETYPDDWKALQGYDNIKAEMAK